MENVEIKETKNKGKGIFALKEFKKGEEILFIKGDVIETENPSEYPKKIQEHWGPIGKEGNKFKFITPEEQWMYMNHSCDSNAGIIDDRKLTVRTKIKKGDEITIDYSALDIELINDGKKELSMVCICKSKNCRKKIETFDKLKKEEQEKLKPFLNKYMRKKYKKII